MNAPLRSYRLTFKIAGLQFVRHVRARDEDHVREQAHVIAEVLKNAGLSLREIIFLSYAVEDG